MKRIALLIVSIAILPTVLSAQSSSPGNALSSAEKQQGWKLLFDGTSLDGWHSFNKKTVGKAWNIDHGAIHLDASNKSNYQSQGGGDLVSADSYQNFDLKLEWKISKNGNSGIIFDVQEDPKYADTWLTGPEMQVLDNDGHPDGKIHKHRAADLYDLIASSSEPVKAVGEWNQAEIKLNNGKLDLFLNGVNVVSTTMWDDNWWKMVKESKFGKMPDFTKVKSGHIALQDHGNDVWFRDIKILQL